jgi:hypothetical protein
MPKITYVPHKFNQKTAKLLVLANQIIEDYAAQGFDLTLRQLYYQLVPRDVIPNKQSEYKRLGDIISAARRAGQVDWDAIVERTRNLRSLTHWNDPAEILEGAERSFTIDKWDDELWGEKVDLEKQGIRHVDRFINLCYSNDRMLKCSLSCFSP